MADTTFSNGTVITPEWLNEVNNATFSPIYVLLNGVPTEYTTLAAAVIGVGSTPCTVYVRGNITMAASATFPSTVTLHIVNGAIITTTGFTLTAKVLCHAVQCFSGTGTVVFLKGSSAVYPEWFGAAGDGSTDDTTAIDKTEAAAYTSGLPITLSANRTYVYNGSLLCRVSLYGNKSTVKQGSSTLIANVGAGVLRAGAAGIFFYEVIVDANVKSTGFTADAISNVTWRDCEAVNCINAGFNAFDADNLLWDRCKASNIRYGTTSPADGFYVGGCTRSSWVDCVASDFRRIGFVSESNTGKSDFIVAQRCQAFNANNCDDSATEYNAAFWFENTNNVNCIDCIGYSLAGNSGQTSGRVRGFVFGLGNTSRGTVLFKNCRVYGGSGYLPSGFNITGTSTNADAVVEDCFVQTARSGIVTGCGFNSFTIRNFAGHDVVNTLSSHGGVLIDGTGASLLRMTIDGLSFTNSTFNADSGWVNFYVAPGSCVYTISRVKGGTHVMVGQVQRVRVEDSSFSIGSTTYGSFLGTQVEIINSHLTSRNSSANDVIVKASAATTGSSLFISGGSVTGYGSGWTNEFGGTGYNITCIGVRFDNFTFNISTTGTFVNRFSDSDFYNVPVTVGSIRTNANSPTKQVLIVLGCYFESANSADTPIRLWTNAPTNAILQGNTRKTATNLHNLGTITSDVNNVSV